MDNNAVFNKIVQECYFVFCIRVFFCIFALVIAVLRAMAATMLNVNLEDDMKKKYSLVLMAAAFAMQPFCSLAQQPGLSGNLKLKGVVKMLRETTRGTYNQVLYNISEYHFNSMGFVTTLLLEDTLGTPKVEVRSVFDSLGEFQKELRFALPDRTLLMENTYQRDWHRNTLTVQMMGVMDSLDDRIVYQFNDRGLVESISTKDSRNKLLSRDFYEYDDDGNCTQIFYTEGSEGRYIRTEHMRYDNQGNEIERSIRNVSAERQHLVFVYEFDTRGNWVTKYVYELKGKEGKLLQTVTREIIYYE